MMQRWYNKCAQRDPLFADIGPANQRSALMHRKLAVADDRSSSVSSSDANPMRLSTTVVLRCHGVFETNAAVPIIQPTIHDRPHLADDRVDQRHLPVQDMHDGLRQDAAGMCTSNLCGTAGRPARSRY